MSDDIFGLKGKTAVVAGGGGDLGGAPIWLISDASASVTEVEIPVWPIESYGDPDLVRVMVAACGVCGSDFRYCAGENPWAMHTLGRHVDNPPNIVLGHEFASKLVIRFR